MLHKIKILTKTLLQIFIQHKTPMEKIKESNMGKFFSFLKNGVAIEYIKIVIHVTIEGFLHMYKIQHKQNY